MRILRYTNEGKFFPNSNFNNDQFYKSVNLEDAKMCNPDIYLKYARIANNSKAALLKKGHCYIEATDISFSVASFLLRQFFSWRHKLHAAVKNAIKDIKLSRTIQLDAIYKSINLKGTKKHNMPRYSKKRTGSAFRGISHHKVCIISGIDDCDNMFFEIVRLGRKSIEHVRSIKGKIEDIDLLITDQAWVYTTISKEWDCRLDQIPTSSYKSPLGNSLADLNSLHRELNNYLTNYQGVSIRHLQGYLDMFVFVKNLKYKYEYEERVLNAYLKAIPTSTTLYS